MVYDDDDEADDWKRFAPLLPKKAKPKSTLSRCLKCNTPQVMKLDGVVSYWGVYGYCPKCGYIERWSP